MASLLCHQEKHKMTDFLAKDVEEHDTLVVQVETKAEEAIEKREEGERPLVIEQDQLQAKLDAVKALIEENRVAKGKLRAVVAHCKEMKQLPSARKATAFMRKNLENKLKEVKKEVELADQFLKRSIPPSVVRRVEVNTFPYKRD